MDVKLNAPLNRGNVEAAAGAVVNLPDGLARRLIDRGHAALHNREGADGPAPKPGRGKAKLPPVEKLGAAPAGAGAPE